MVTDASTAEIKETERLEQERQARAVLEEVIAAEQDAALAKVRAACDAERAATGGVVESSPENKLPT